MMRHRTILPARPLFEEDELPMPTFPLAEPASEVRECDDRPTDPIPADQAITLRPEGE